MLCIISMLAIIGVVMGFFEAVCYLDLYYMQRMFDANATYNFIPLLVGVASLIIMILCDVVKSAILSDEKELDGGYDTDDLVPIRIYHGTPETGNESSLIYIVSVKEKNMYLYFCMTEDGSIQRKGIKIKNARIFEKEFCSRPRVVAHKRVLTYNHPKLAVILALSENDSDNFFYRYDIIVPKNTVVRDYRLD